MLLGEHEHTLDDKNRLTLPAKFRQDFAEGIVVTRGMDGCLFAYTRGDWSSLVERRLATLDPLSKEGRRMQRFFFSGAAETELDKQGRVGLPSALLEHATLGAGGHASLLTADLHGRGKLIAVDRDPTAKTYFERLAKRSSGINARLLRGDF